MHAPVHIDIAGLGIDLHDAQSALADLNTLYAEFNQRSDAYKSDAANPHLCKAGCSHCCKRGAFFGVTLAEAVAWSAAIESLPAGLRINTQRAAQTLIDEQARLFADNVSPPDMPGERDEPSFSARISRLNRDLGPACPLLKDDLCTVYESRPMLCRAYGFPVDAYAVKTDAAIVFRSLCQLYDGLSLSDYVRAEDLKDRLRQISRRLGGNRDWGRFTSAEAIVATLTYA
jgi:Fe-S-cluster containining protein